VARSTNKHKLKTEYDKLLPLATRFCIAMKEQLEQLITSNGLSLGVPLECRVKTFESAMAKIKAQPKAADSILALDDFIGFRLILLFKRDLDKTHQVIFDSFRVSAHEDTAERLQETEFGYQSRHYQINLPPEWMSVPTYNQFSDLRAEIQVRTLAQHEV
jgi:putative GTP pyrophosphokinase